MPLVFACMSNVASKIVLGLTVPLMFLMGHTYTFVINKSTDKQTGC